MRLTLRRKVVFPQPDGPIKLVIMPALTFRLTSFRASTVPVSWITSSNEVVSASRIWIWTTRRLSLVGSAGVSLAPSASLQPVWPLAWH